MKPHIGLCLCCALILSPAAQAFSEDLKELQGGEVDRGEWRLTKNDKLHQIKVYVKNEEGKKIRSFRVEAMLDAPIETVARVQADVDNYVKWYFAALESKLLKKVSDKEFIFYLVHDAPIGTPDRDVVMRAVIEPMTKTRPFVVIRMSALPDFLPPRPPYVRMEAENYTIRWTPVGKDKTLLESEGYIDPGGTAPSWAVNFVQGKGPYTNMMGMQRMITLPQYNDPKAPQPFRFFE